MHKSFYERNDDCRFHLVANYRDHRSLAARLRQKRFAFFQSLLARVPQRPITILDIGGEETTWLHMPHQEHTALPPFHVTLLNLDSDPVTLPWVKSIAGDARHMPAIATNSFDVVYSNSVIEHIGNDANRQRMAAEVQRVAPRYFIQTPNKYFPIEPHFLVPFFQFLPIPLRSMLMALFDLGWYKKRSYYDAHELVCSIKLLTRREIVALFPQAMLYEERFMGFVKSFVAYGGWER